MTDKTTASLNTIPCEICLNEIPSAVTSNAEFDAYVSNYCGLECYEQWREKQIEDEKAKKTN